MKFVFILDGECSTAHSSGTAVRNFSFVTVYRNVRQKLILFRNMPSLSVMCHHIISCLAVSQMQLQVLAMATRGVLHQEVAMRGAH